MVPVVVDRLVGRFQLVLGRVRPAQRADLAVDHGCAVLRGIDELAREWRDYPTAGSRNSPLSTALLPPVFVIVMTTLPRTIHWR